ncbi:MAG TPA: AAA family ATPase [Candidatus Dormibacteraeota bacterium]|nr:AAA family ATPase [Candidatus Dormibacteraeota bacterium]
MPELSLDRDTWTGSGRRKRRMIIAVSGPHGTGKSTYAARIAKALRFRHVSAGVLFRRIARENNHSLEEFGKKALEDSSIDKIVDERTIKEADAGNVVIDGQLAGWVLRDKADLRICLTAPENVRLERIAKRDKIDVEKARLETEQRESVQRERYLRHYGFHVEDRSIYHLVLDTSLGSIDDTAKVLIDVALMVKKAKRKQRGTTKP